MSEDPETPQQRQARIRREKREAKIKAGGQERLDKITRLSGRTPESMRNESPVQTPSLSQSSTPARTTSSTAPPPLSAMMTQPDDPEQKKLQEEYMKALFGGLSQEQSAAGQQPTMPNEDDPMMKMMQSLMGNMNGDPGSQSPGDLPFSPDDISKMTGLPSFVTDMFLGGKQPEPPSPEELSKERTWKIIRIIISCIVGLYTIVTLQRSVEAFGQNPPTPATAQNPFVIFLMAELLIYGARSTISGRPKSRVGFKSWIQSGREYARDGAILVFMLGVYSWWSGYA